MPVLFRSGSLVIYYWSNEGIPTESVHVHVSYNGEPNTADKFWLSKDGYFVPDKKNKCIKQRTAYRVLDSFISTGGIANLIEAWRCRFGDIRYFDD